MTANRIKEVRAMADLTQTELATLIGISQQQVAKLETGKQRLSSEMAVSIARALCVGLHDIIPTGERPLVPFVGRVSAGGMVQPFPQTSDRPRPPLEAPPLTQEGSVALEVLGDGLFPAYRSGDVLILDPPEAPREAVREECCVTLADGRMLLRRVMPGSEGRFSLIGVAGPEASEAVVLECRRVRHIIRARTPAKIAA